MRFVCLMVASWLIHHHAWFISYMFKTFWLYCSLYCFPPFYSFRTLLFHYVSLCADPIFYRLLPFTQVWVWMPSMIWIGIMILKLCISPNLVTIKSVWLGQVALIIGCHKCVCSESKRLARDLFPCDLAESNSQLAEFLTFGLDMEFS